MRFIAKCLFCSWISKPSLGPVFAGREALKHAKENHEEKDGLVAVIVKKEPNKK